MYTIEKHIPLPPLGTQVYPFAEMAVGDSFFVNDGGRKKQMAVLACARTFGRKNAMKFTTRMQGDGFRVWRIE